MNLAWTLLVAAAVACATPAAAAVTWQVDGLFDTPGGSLTGTFVTNDALTQVTAVHLSTSYDAGFQGATYSDVSDIDAQWLPQYFRITVPMGGGLSDQLQIFFSPQMLGAQPEATSYAFTGFEHQDYGGAGNRMLSGVAKVVGASPAGVPEPQTWALLIGGLGLAGTALRRQRLHPQLQT